MSAGRAAALHALTLVAASALALLVYSPRVPKGDPAANAFSVERARADLERIARRPHPVGSEEHADVRAYLEGRLEMVASLFPEAGGRRPSVTAQEGSVPADEWSDFEGEVPLANLVLHVPGTLRAGALLLAAHYDSRESTPGAGDDGAACASWLEVLRALSVDGPPAMDLLLLLTDGEEQGLCGAELFAEEYELQRRGGVLEQLEDELEPSFVGEGRERPPWAVPLRGVLNFEAIGHDGPSVLFQTGVESGAFVDAYAAVPHPVGSSLAPWIYDQLPNDTDLTVFRRMGLPGLNFAIVGGGSAYHRPHDTAANLPDATLAHQGRTMLALVRELDARAGDLGPAPDRGFQDLLGGGFVTFAPGLNRWLGLVAIVAAVLVLRENAGGHPLLQLVRGTWAGLLTFLVLGLVTLVVVKVGTAFGSLVAPLLGVGDEPRGNRASVTIGYLATLLAAFGAFPLTKRLGGLAAPRDREDGATVLCAAGALFLVALASRWLAHQSPEGAHTVAVPAVLACAALALVGRGEVAPWRHVLGAVCVLLAVAPTAALWHVLVQVLGTDPASARTVGVAFGALTAVLAGPSLARLPARPTAVAGLSTGLALALGAGLLEVAGA